MSKKLIVALLVVVTLVPLSLVLVAHQKPDFTGDYVLNKQRSTLASDFARLERATVHIEHRDPVFVMHRVFTEGGKDDVLDVQVRTDGQETVTKSGTRTEYSRGYWEGDTLAFVTRIVIPTGEATNVVHYRLIDGGRTLQAEERFRAPRMQHDNVWIFEKK